VSGAEIAQVGGAVASAVAAGGSATAAVVLYRRWRQETSPRIAIEMFAGVPADPTRSGRSQVVVLVHNLTGTEYPAPFVMLYQEGKEPARTPMGKPNTDRLRAHDAHMVHIDPQEFDENAPLHAEVEFEGIRFRSAQHTMNGPDLPPTVAEPLGQENRDTVPSMVRVVGGAVMVIAGIAAFIEAHSHRPSEGRKAAVTEGERAYQAREKLNGIKLGPIGHHGLSSDAYDLLRIGGWALIIFGALLIVVGLIAYSRRVARA
jgi:hypothetical protein